MRGSLSEFIVGDVWTADAMMVDSYDGWAIKQFILSMLPNRRAFLEGNYWMCGEKMRTRRAKVARNSNPRRPGRPIQSLFLTSPFDSPDVQDTDEA